MAPGTSRGLLVHLLLYVFERGLQVECGQQLPAQQMGIVPAHLGCQRQVIGQQHGVGRLIEPAPQTGLGIEPMLLVEQVFVPGDVQHLGKLLALFEQQTVTLGHPLRQAPLLGHGLAQRHDANTEQLLLDNGGVFSFMDDPQLPGVEQLRVGQCQRP